MARQSPRHGWSVVLPLAFLLLLLGLSVAVLLRRRRHRRTRARRIKLSSRYFDDDTLEVNGGLEPVDEMQPMDLPPVD